MFCGAGQGCRRSERRGYGGTCCAVSQCDSDLLLLAAVLSSAFAELDDSEEYSSRPCSAFAIFLSIDMELLENHVIQSQHFQRFSIDVVYGFNGCTTPGPLAVLRLVTVAAALPGGGRPLGGPGHGHGGRTAWPAAVRSAAPLNRWRFMCH